MRLLWLSLLIAACAPAAPAADPPPAAVHPPAPTAVPEAPVPKEPRLAVAAHVVDEECAGKLMVSVDFKELREGITIESGTLGTVTIKKTSDAAREELMSWVTKHAPKRRFVTVPYSVDGKRVGWAAICIDDEALLTGSDLESAKGHEAVVEEDRHQVDYTLKPDARARVQALEGKRQRLVWLVNDETAGLNNIEYLSKHGSDAIFLKSLPEEFHSGPRVERVP